MWSSDPAARLRRLAHTFWFTYAWWQKLLLPAVFVGLGVARLVVLTLPLRFYGPALGRRTALNDRSSSPVNPARASGIARVVTACARFTPWDSNCLAQAIVAACLLRLFRVRYSLHLGLRRNTADEFGGLEAHAWTMAGDHPITGFRESQGMTEVATFAWPIPEK